MQMPLLQNGDASSGRGQAEGTAHINRKRLQHDCGMLKILTRKVKLH